MSGYEELVGVTSSTEAPQAVETPAAPVVSETPAASPEPAQPSSAVEAPVTASQPAPSEPQDPMAPVKALLDERERRQAAERKALQYEAQVREIERRRREAAQQRPNVLDDPDAYDAYWENRVKTVESSLVQQHQRQLEQLSRNMMARHLGAEKFGELDKFIKAAPDQAHAVALKQADPYGWFYEKYEQAMKARKAEEAARELEKLGGKSLDEVIAERVAAAIAERQAQANPSAAPVAETRTQPRDETGKFAPSNSTTPRTAPSLATVNGAPAPSGSDVRGGYDALFKQRG